MKNESEQQTTGQLIAFMNRLAGMDGNEVVEHVMKTLLTSAPKKPWTLILTIDRGNSFGPQTHAETTKYESVNPLRSKEDAQVAALLWISQYRGMGITGSICVEIATPEGKVFEETLKGMSNAVIEEYQRELRRLNAQTTRVS